MIPREKMIAHLEEMGWIANAVPRRDSADDIEWYGVYNGDLLLGKYPAWKLEKYKGEDWCEEGIWSTKWKRANYGTPWGMLSDADLAEFYIKIMMEGL